MTLPTMKIVNHVGAPKVINEEDFDPDVHTSWADHEATAAKADVQIQVEPVETKADAVVSDPVEPDAQEAPEATEAAAPGLETEAEAVVAEPADVAEVVLPASREDIEKAANDMHVKFSANISDAKLLERVKDAREDLVEQANEKGVPFPQALTFAGLYEAVHGAE